MNDLDAAAYLREIQQYNRDGVLLTPQNNDFDIFWDSAIAYAIRALEERAGVSGKVEYTQNPNGSFSIVVN